jgi:DNA-binding response OmpR family regulator
MGSKRIIIVDDDRDLREMLRLRLELAGYQVRVAASGLRLLSSLKVDPPDLILLDVMMSWINGFELCLALKQNPAYARIPVFFISALTSPEDRDKGLACGCTRYFTKPLDLDQLLQEIRAVLDQPT